MITKYCLLLLLFDCIKNDDELVVVISLHFIFFTAMRYVYSLIEGINEKKFTGLMIFFPFQQRLSKYFH